VHATTDEVPLVRLELEHERLQPMPAPWPGLLQPPARNVLDQYDFNFATGAPRKQIIELASLALVERAQNVVFLGPSHHSIIVSINGESFRLKDKRKARALTPSKAVKH
jgi:hypothetical protein